jgi:hypothetical protein
MNRVWPHALAAAALALAPAAPAFAQAAVPSLDDLSEDQQRQLANLYDLAESNAEGGEWRKALGYFQDAYEMFPHPRLLYQIARCHDKLGEEAAALNAYRRFVADLPDATEVPEAKRRIASLQTKQAVEATSLRIKSSPAGAVVYLDDVANGAVGTTPTIDLPLEAKTYTVIVEMDGYLTAQRTVELAPGAARTEEFALERDPNFTVTDPVAGPGRGPGAAPVTLAIVGGVGLASAIGFGVLWAGVADPAACRANGCTSDEAVLYETMTYVSGGVAVLGLAGALLLWNRPGSPGRAGRLDTTPSVGAWALPGGGGVTVQGRF